MVIGINPDHGQGISALDRAIDVLRHLLSGRQGIVSYGSKPGAVGDVVVYTSCKEPLELPSEIDGVAVSQETVCLITPTAAPFEDDLTSGKNESWTALQNLLSTKRDIISYGFDSESGRVVVYKSTKDSLELPLEVGGYPVVEVFAEFQSRLNPGHSERGGRS